MADVVVGDDMESLTQLEHVHLNPDMWGGVNVLKTTAEWVRKDNSIIRELLTYSPLWLKMVDEVLVNAIDQHTKHPRSVKDIMVDFDKTTGEISIYNNGSGISCTKDTNGNYAPQKAFCTFLTGNNFRTKGKITGGKNGVGAKLTNAFSEYFIIETSDSKKKVYYRQEVTNCMKKINRPTIQKWTDVDESYRHAFTRITFKPEYKLLGYPSNKITADMRETFLKLIESRCLFASISCGARVYLNDKEIIEKTLFQLAECALPGMTDNMLTFNIKDANKDRNQHWDVVIAITPDEGFRQISFVNGINTREGGSHVKWFVDLFISQYKDRIMKKYNMNKWNRAFIERYLFVFVRAVVEDPGFNSQAKEVLNKPDVFPDYQFPKNAYKKIMDQLTAFLDGKNNDKIKDKETKKKTKVHAAKYESAEKAGTKQAHKCSLFIPEGDSAAGFVSLGIKEKETDLSTEYYGIFNIQGVPINARKESKIVKDSKGREMIIRNDKLKKSERWSALVEVLGLDYTYHYDMNNEGNAQYNKLRYGQVIVAVDQDIDGVGHIFGLILNFFHLFWPKLIDRGYIKRLSTPLIRAYPITKGKILSFYSDKEYNDWRINNGFDDKITGYTIHYYKGLATHSDEEVIDIFKKFKDKLYIYTRDNLTDQLFDTYFNEDIKGKNAARKAELRLPLVDYTPQITPDGNFITCTQQLQYECKEHYQGDCLRSLPHVMDGLRPAVRQVLCAARKKFKTNNKLIKTGQFAGFVMEHMHYHHGPQSLENSIVKLAQRYPGSTNLPYLCGKGRFGSRARCGKDAGASRYIEVKLNRDLTYNMFPEIDDGLLDYNFDDGERCEPLYYLPVLPTCLLEDYECPGSGWKAEFWARDYKEVIANVRSMIAGEEPDDMSYWLQRNSCDVIYGANNSMKIIGKLHLDEKDPNIVHITEIPPRMGSSIWRDKRLGIEKKKKDDDKDKTTKTKVIKPDENIEDIIDKSTDTQINIKVIFKPGAIKMIEKGKWGDENIDYITDYLGIYTKCGAFINCTGINKCVEELTDYKDVLNIWFVARKKLYGMRVDRRIKQLEYLILMYENMIRYAEHYPEYKLAGKKKDTAVTILNKNDYVMLNKSHIMDPGYVKNEELEDYFKQNASFDYLLQLNDLQRLEGPNKKRVEELEKLQEELKDLLKDDKYFKGAKFWLKEIDMVEKIIDEGIACDWNYDKKKAKFQ